MDWITEYVIDKTGLCRWRDGYRITDEEMKNAYRQNAIFEFVCETSAIMGVKIGMA